MHVACHGVRGKLPRLYLFDVYDRWMGDSRVGFQLDSQGVNLAFRTATAPVAKQSPAKAPRDCCLLAARQVAESALVTFDSALAAVGSKAGCPVVLLR